MLDLIALDADDTLWENEELYATMRDRFRRILAGYEISGSIEERLDAIEMRNLPYYGYGAKGFVLSLIETAIEVTGGHISAADIGSIAAIAREMIAADIRLLDHVEPVVRELSQRHALILVTKGDILHQQSKVARSGLRDYFHEIVVVSDKTRDTYAGILKRYTILPERFIMVGNSMRSDILPVLELGGWGVYVPRDLTWGHERMDLPERLAARFFEVEHFGKLPALIERLEQGAT
jgi:putative hydrolase of the HAD superfamily